MQCINYIGMKGKARSTLCSLVYEKEDKIFVNNGCICIQDADATSVVLVTNSGCFFHGTNGFDTLSTHFNLLRTIEYQDIFRGGLSIYVLNQLNGRRPFSAHSGDFSICLSKYDSAFSCSPKGPDIFTYDMSM